MTENEELKKAALQLKAMVICTSIKKHRSCSGCVNENDCGKDEYDTDIIFAKSANIIFDALEELESYRAIGTIEELKALKEKNTAKKAIVYGHNDAVGTDVGLCPVCNDRPLRACDNQYCPDCGQKLDWSE